MAATSPEVLLDAPRRQRLDRGHIAALTGLRGFAALAVLVVHASSLSQYPWVGLHNYGPIALFVLSGFLLFQPWSKWMLGIRPRPDIREFARRRFWRIFPPYLVVLFTISLIHPIARPDDAGAWLRNLTLTHVYRRGDLGNGLFHTWSLATELAWYLLLPAVGISVAWFARRFSVSVTNTMVVSLLFATAVGIGWRWLYYEQVLDAAFRATMPNWLPGFLMCFLGGALCGHLVVRESISPNSSRLADWVASHQGLILIVSLASGVLAASRLGGPWTLWASENATLGQAYVRFGGMMTMALLLLAGVALAPRAALLRTLFGHPVMETLGRWSYGIYLWHMPAIVILSDHIGGPKGPIGLALRIALIAAISIPLGAATYRFIEQPAIKWSKRVRTSTT